MSAVVTTCELVEVINGVTSYGGRIHLPIVVKVAKGKVIYDQCSA